MDTPFGREGSECSEGKVLRIDRPLAGGFNVPPLAGGKVVRSTKRGRGYGGGFAANFISCFAAVVNPKNLRPIGPSILRTL